MKRWSFYSQITGELTGRTFAASNPAALERNTPAHCGAVEGEHDHLSRRVDLASGQVVDFQPPSPGPDHEWNEGSRRWVKRADVLARESENVQIMHEIEQLERAADRPLREIALDGNNATALTRLRAIDERIALLRAKLTQG